MTKNLAAFVPVIPYLSRRIHVSTFSACFLWFCLAAQTAFALPCGVQVLRGDQPAGSGIRVSAQKSDQTTSVSKSTNSTSTAQFNVGAGAYTFSTSFSGQTFQTQGSCPQSNLLSLPDFTRVQMEAPGVVFPASQSVQAQTTSGLNLGYSLKPDASLQAGFTLTTGTYQFRTHFNGLWFYSPPAQSGESVSIQIPKTLNVHVFAGGQPVGTGLQVTPLSTDKVNLSPTRLTDSSGIASFNLPSGSYYFRYQDPNGKKHLSGLAETEVINFYFRIDQTSASTIQIFPQDYSLQFDPQFQFTGHKVEILNALGKRVQNLAVGPSGILAYYDALQAKVLKKFEPEF